MKIISEVDGKLICESADGNRFTSYCAPTEVMVLELKQLEVSLTAAGNRPGAARTKCLSEFQLRLFGKAKLRGSQTVSIAGHPNTASNAILVQFQQEDEETEKSKRETWDKANVGTPTFPDASPGNNVGRPPYPLCAMLRCSWGDSDVYLSEDYWSLFLLVNPSIFKSIVSRVDSKTLSSIEIALNYQGIYKDNDDWVSPQKDTMGWLLKPNTCANGDIIDIKMNHLWSDPEIAN